LAVSTSNNAGKKTQEKINERKKDSGKNQAPEKKVDPDHKNKSVNNDSGKNESANKKDAGKSNKPDTRPSNKNKPVKNKHESVRKNDADKSKKSDDKQGKKKVTVKKTSEEQNDRKDKSATPFALSIPPSQPQQTNDINYAKGERITVLHIAEKPSIGQAIANGLASGNIKSGGKMLPVHEFTDPPFPKAPKASKCVHKVTSVAGHVFSVDFPPQFQSWDSVDPAELFDAPVVKKPNKGSVIKHLQDEARGVDFIVLWMDCDRYVCVC
jgi:DNA topoisomerase-3